MIQVAPVGALAALSLRAGGDDVASGASRGNHVSIDALLTLGFLDLLEGHGRLGLRVQILQVQRVLHVVHAARAGHDI